MREVTSVENLEALVGTRPQMVLMKAIDALDDGCRVVLANAPIAGFGYRAAEGTPRSTVVGGAPGFTRVESPTRVSFDMSVNEPSPMTGSGVSLIFLLPGIGETLRLTGSIVDRSNTCVVIDLDEAFTHCAKCILRSRLWDDVGLDSEAPSIEPPTRDDDARGPLADAAIVSFLASSSFAFISSWDASGSSDTSPKGDRPGFIEVLDACTLAMPDRKGNRRTDTFHNLLSCNQVALATLVPGRDDLLHMNGTASVTDEPALLARMTVADGEKPPKAGLVIRVNRAELRRNEAVQMSRMRDPSAHVDPAAVPDLMQLGAQHLAHNKTRGAKASMTRALSRGFAATPKKLMRRGIDLGYRKDLESEGYSPPDVTR